MRYETVLFDLDGTLIDSAELILASMRHATRTVLGRDYPDEALLAGVGSPLHAQVREFDEERVEDLVQAFRDYNEPQQAALLPCEGVLDVVRALHDEGRRLGVVTSKRHLTVGISFDALPELASYFDVVVAAEDTERHKPHGEPVLLALERLGAPREGAVYVGDAPFDIAAAKAAGIASIAVTWGKFHSRERLEQEEPDAIVDTPEELLGSL